MMKVSKKEEQKFRNDFERIMEENGYEKTGKSQNLFFSKGTSVGELNVSIHKEQGILFSVFMRFGDDFNKSKFERIRKNETFNRYSGKWNIHSKDSDYVLKELRERLEDLK